MSVIYPKKLSKGDHISVIAPSKSLAIISKATVDFAIQRLKIFVPVPTGMRKSDDSQRVIVLAQFPRCRRVEPANERSSLATVSAKRRFDSGSRTEPFVGMLK